MITELKVAGDPVRLVALPKYTPKALATWRAFIDDQILADCSGVAGMDVESTAIEGLGMYDPKIAMRLIQFGTRNEAWALDPHDPRWRREILALLKSDVRFVSHNAAFDTTRVLYEFGIDLGDRSLDTLPMACLLWPGRTCPGGHGLKALSDSWIDSGLSEAEVWLHAAFVDRWTAQKPRKNSLLPHDFEPGSSTCRQTKKRGEDKCQEVSFAKSLCGLCLDHYLAKGRTRNSAAEQWGWANIELTDPFFLEYAGLDAVYVRRLLDILGAKLRQSGMARLSRTEQKVKRVMNASAVRGMKVDLDWTVPLLEDTTREFEAAALAIFETTGGLKPRSPRMREWLADQGVRAKSLDKEHLPELLARYAPDSGPAGDSDDVSPEAARVLRNLDVVSHTSNLLANLRTIYTHAVDGDGFVHPNINTMQAHTGRFSYTGPAMQTLAKKGDKGTKLRGCFVARDGFVLVGADYDSQEIRISAALSRDPAMLKIVTEGLNQHILTAESIFPGQWRSKAETPDLYAIAKTLDFAIQYGAMPKKIAQTLGITPRESTVLWQRWRKTYSGLVRWSEKLATQRAIRNPFGRVVPRDEWGREYASANYACQSTGRDVLGTALERLDAAGYGSSVWMTVHDEAILEVPEDRADDACAALTQYMTMSIAGVEIPAEGEIIGHRWAGLG